MASRDGDFLGRWSRRKVESRQGLKRREPAPEEQQAPRAPVAEKPVAARLPDAPPLAEAPSTVRESELAETLEEQLRQEEAAPTIAVNQTPSARDDEEEASEEELAEFADVDFDKLDYETDYHRFMQEGVPEAIRRRALRKLWGSDPILANLDGLNDYDDDFTDAALAIKIVGSNYKPGTGYLTEEERRASYGEDAPADETKEAEVAQDAPAGEAAGTAQAEQDADGDDADQTGADKEPVRDSADEDRREAGEGNDTSKSEV